jgi:hypothetical protein
MMVSALCPLPICAICKFLRRIGVWDGTTRRGRSCCCVRRGSPKMMDGSAWYSIPIIAKCRVLRRRDIRGSSSMR